MDCSNCGQCCQRLHDDIIDLHFFELIELLRIKKFDYIHDPFQDRMKLPCPFLDSNTKKCTIYNERPLQCRLFPIKATEYYGKVIWFLHNNCPQVKQVVEFRLNHNISSLQEGLDCIKISKQELQQNIEDTFRNDALPFIYQNQLLSPIEFQMFMGTMLKHNQQDSSTKTILVSVKEISMQEYMTNIKAYYESISKNTKFMAYLREMLAIYRKYYL